MNEPMTDVSMTPPPEQKSGGNRTLIIVLVLLLVLCCCCACIATWGLWTYGDQLFKTSGAVLPLLASL